MIPVWFTPTRAGEYEIVCSQLCGLTIGNIGGGAVLRRG